MFSHEEDFAGYTGKDIHQLKEIKTKVGQTTFDINQIELINCLCYYYCLLLYARRSSYVIALGSPTICTLFNLEII